MNKRRNQQGKMNLFEAVLLLLAVVILMGAGVTHAWVKNSQVEVVHAVDKVERSISDHEDSINSLQVKIDKKLNLYQLRDDLQRAGSQLVLIPVSSIEKIHPYVEGEARESSPALAQRRP